MAKKNRFNGIVVFRTPFIYRTSYTWAVRIYRNGKILFEGPRSKRLGTLVDVVDMVGTDLCCQLQIGSNKRELDGPEDLVSAKTTAWLKPLIAVENKRLTAKPRRARA